MRHFARLLFLVALGLILAACQTQGSTTSSLTAGDSEAAAMSADTQVLSSRQRSLGAVQPTTAAADNHFIEFRSRYALSYGHSFVVFGRLGPNGEMINPEVAGLAPKSDDPGVYMLGHVTPVPASTGETDGDLEEEYISARWRVMLSEAEYRKVVADIRKLQANSPVWHAALYNCNAFVGDIARSMGYKVPFHWLSPQQYITRLKEMNEGSRGIGERTIASSSRN
jgi:hypothetical protein